MVLADVAADMTFRFTIGKDARGHVVRVAGQLTGDGSAELERAVASLSGQVRLDLADLRSADGPALDMLRDLRARGVVLARASPYLSLLLGGPHGTKRKG